MEGILKQRGVAMPRHLCLQTDNTCREQRNQFAFLWGAWLTGVKAAFDSVTLNFYEVGHTHNEVDQRFVVVGAALAKATVLQDPEDGL